MMTRTRTQSTTASVSPGARFVRSLAFGLALLGLAAGARAQDAGNAVQIHGFGGWAYAQTDDNSYIIGTKQGTYDNLSMALNVNGTVTEKLTVVGQFELARRPGFDKLETQLDFAFAEWKFTDALKLRAGRVKHPFGLYGEIFSVGTLRPFYMLPQGIYGPQRFTARSVDGMGITGMKNWDNGWGLNYDVYAGRIAGELRIRGFGTEGEELHLGAQNLSFSFNEVIGGRLVVTTPVQGLSLGASAYRGKATIEVLSVDGQSPNPNEEALDLHAEYQAGRILIRAEYGRVFDDPTISYHTYYVEGAVKVYRGLQLAARYDRWQGDLEAQFVQPGYDFSSLKHRDISLGVNYWLSPSFVIKASYHDVQGNLFALPDDPTAPLAHDTNMFVIGTQFSF